MTLPVVVTKSMFQETPLLFIGIAPPALEKNPAASRMFFMAAKGAFALPRLSASTRDPPDRC